MHGEHRNAAASRAVGHQISRGEPADLAAVAPLPRERPPVKSRRGVQDGHLGVEDLAAAIGSRVHPINLLLHRRNDLVVAGQREESATGSEQQRNAVIPEQRTSVTLASPARRERVKVLTKPPAHACAVHGHGPYRCCTTTASVHCPPRPTPPPPPPPQSGDGDPGRGGPH